MKKKQKQQRNKIPIGHIYFDVGSRIHKPEGVGIDVKPYKRG